MNIVKLFINPKNSLKIKGTNMFWEEQKFK